MNYHLSFLDDVRRAQDVWEADFGTEHPAISWMWIAGSVWAQRADWSTMELWCRRCSASRAPCPRIPSAKGDCCIARIPASALGGVAQPERSHRARPIILILEHDAFTAILHEGVLLAGGCSVASFANCASAEMWLGTNSPDAAVIDVKPGDKGCTELAQKLLQREIPFLAVSNYSNSSPGVHRIFRPVPWFEKPLTSAGLQLALRSIL
jgi:CheY-like chemotaxis protein